jgi:hypothetical protein
VTVASTDEFNCTSLKALEEEGVIKGSFSCSSKSSFFSSPSGGGSSDSFSHKKPSIGAIVGGVIGGLILIAALLAGVFILGRRYGRGSPKKSKLKGDKDSKGEKCSTFGKAELHADSKTHMVNELEGDEQRHELDGTSTEVTAELPSPVPKPGKHVYTQNERSILQQ